ncbi:MAG TPA: InlB B-repeat-containing protein [Candidatus Fimimonas gallinarum]|uniref:InlB B-repeat-containing protein n=1 Tax=Candidatus Fimimonas gallinarum TaxID=2840821 RepID=A0A9D1E4W4_9BACT|nr:InlB B-repeat-containing protein [Candidatus Fimimonas gallinarum]
MKRKISALLAVVFALVLVLTACTPTVYTVTFDAQNGSAPTTVKFDGSFQLPATPQNGDKVFGGWYTDAQCTTPWTVPQTLTGNITVYAKWTEPSVTTGYNVVFDAQNGTSPIIVPFDSNFQLPATPQNGDKVFGGWYTDAQCTTPWTVPETLTGNIVVYAKWTEPSGGGQGGGSQGGGSGEATQLTSVFLDQYLTVANGCLQYTTGSTANSFDDNRGVQFLQNGGVVTIVSSSNVEGVTVVSVTVATNCPTGMQVQVSVGTTPLKCEGETLVTVAQQSHYTQLTTLNFVADEAVSGAITVILTPTAASKSMYISSIAVNGEVGGGSQGGDGGSQGGVSGNVMPQQTYDANTFDSDNLQDKLLAYDGSIGLPSTGNIDCLVVPVQFSDTQAITSADLEKLNKAFNGTAADTGWQSVSSYYALSSYNKLNLNYDIWGVNIGTSGNVFTASHDSAYYNNYNQTVDVGDYTYTQYGDEVILLEVLEWLEGQIDLTKYDTNNDGCIDAVYLIYSADVDYQSDSSIYWAYVTWYSGNRQFDGKDAYYYLFAGFDFMDEDADRADGTEYSGTIEGLNINASTYIHETGHLMGLDDYYDYDMTVGSGEGLGGADMMDYTVGDHGVYSKIMLGWITPTVVTESKTFTIEPSTTSGDCLLVMLDFDNSYFSEYLLIDLYSATGLNALHASQANSYLYDGASYGVRIYHVSSSVNNPYSDEYGSFTDNNNTYSSIPLIKLVEADGENKFAGTRGYASESDLWQTGDVFSRVFPMYTRNDGKLVNFDITVDSVSQTSATVTITFQAE